MPETVKEVNADKEKDDKRGLARSSVIGLSTFPYQLVDTLSRRGRRAELSREGTPSPRAGYLLRSRAQTAEPRKLSLLCHTYGRPQKIACSGASE